MGSGHRVQKAGEQPTYEERFSRCPQAQKCLRAPVLKDGLQDYGCLENPFPNGLAKRRYRRYETETAAQCCIRAAPPWVVQGLR